MAANRKAEAEEYKVLGNKLFQNGDYYGAEKQYSLAIIADSSNANLFTNRALVRMRQGKNEEVILDCNRAIELVPSSMKAYYYLGQAQLGLSRPNEALQSCLKAYELAVEQHSKSASSISLMVLQAKKQRWERMERRRVDSEMALLTEIKQVIRTESERRVRELTEQSDMMGGMEWDWKDEVDRVRREANERCKGLEDVFARADPEKYKMREVPDYLMDTISFTIMHDPVMLPNGQSYDKTTILDHLKRSKTDPLTREPLSESDLRPNLGLKQACDQFIEENGWAVDY